MQPKDNSFEESHGELFRSSLEQILDRKVTVLPTHLYVFGQPGYEFRQQ